MLAGRSHEDQNSHRPQSAQQPQPIGPRLTGIGKQFPGYQWWDLHSLPECCWLCSAFGTFVWWKPTYPGLGELATGIRWRRRKGKGLDSGSEMNMTHSLGEPLMLSVCKISNVQR